METISQYFETKRIKKTDRTHKKEYKSEGWFVKNTYKIHEKTAENENKLFLDKLEDVGHNVLHSRKKKIAFLNVTVQWGAILKSVYEERMSVMSQKIKLNAPEDVREFVKAACKCDFDIDISYNRMIVDAKSILGIFSMDLTRILTVYCHGESEEFESTLKKFAVA